MLEGTKIFTLLEKMESTSQEKKVIFLSVSFISAVIKKVRFESGTIIKFAYVACRDSEQLVPG